MIYCSRDKLDVGAIEILELSDDDGNWHTLPVKILREATKEEYESQHNPNKLPINYIWQYYYQISMD